MALDSDINRIYRILTRFNIAREGYAEADKNYLKTGILLYEKIQHEKRMEALKFPDIPLSWYQD